MSQKSSKDGRQYWIPDNYMVETEIVNKKIHCKIEYDSNQKVKYIIIWKEKNVEWSVFSEKSSSGVVTEFLKVFTNF